MRSPELSSFYLIKLNRFKSSDYLKHWLWVLRCSYPEVFLVKYGSENMQQIYKRIPIPKYDFNKVAKHTSAWVFSCKFAAYFQNTFY